MNVTRFVSLARRLAIAAIAVGVVGLGLATVLAWFPMFPLALLEHFRVQFAAIGIVLVAAAAGLRMRLWFDAAAIIAIVVALPLVPDLASSRRPHADRRTLRILLLNVHTESTSYALVRQLVADERPDVVALVEVSDRWLAELAPALEAYPSRIEHPRPDNFGIALYARGSLDATVKNLGTELPSIVATFDGKLRVILTHPLPPISARALTMMGDQFAAIAAERPDLVMGDLNATPWSAPFLYLKRGTGLCDTRDGLGLQASFPVELAIARIPLDHVLARCDLGIVDRRIGPDVGSDHLPVIVDLATE